MMNIQLGDVMFGPKNQNLLEKVQKKRDPNVYDPHQTPPDVPMALAHGKAKKVHQASDYSTKYRGKKCPCCQLPADGKQIPLTEKLSSIYHLGCGYALYFEMIKYAIGLVGVFLTVGIYNLVTNARSDGCTEATEEAETTTYCIRDYISIFTITNRRNDPQSLEISEMLNFFVVIAVICYFQFLRYKLHKIKTKAEDKLLTPADFTLKLSEIPTQTTNEEIQDLLESFGTSDHPVTVKKILRSYHIGEMVKLMQARKVLNDKKSVAQGFAIILLDAEIDKVNKQLRKLTEKRLNEFITPAVYVTLEAPVQTDVVIKSFNKTSSKKKMKFIPGLLLNTYHRLHGQKIKLKRAPEPSDVLWENLGYSNREKLKRKIITFSMAALLITASFLIIIGIGLGEDKVIQKLGQASRLIKILSLVSSFLLLIFNKYLEEFISKLTEFEKHGSSTGYFTAMAEKLNVAAFTNSALTTLVAKIIVTTTINETHTHAVQTANFYSAGGLLETMFFVFVTDTLYNPIMNLIDPSYVLRRIQRKRVELFPEKSKLNQRKAHKLFEDPSIDMSSKYSLLVTTVLLAAFYAPALPVALIFAMICLTLIYWSDKYILLRRTALPFSLGSELPESMIEHLEWAIFLYACGNAIVAYTLVDNTGELAYSTIPKYWVWLSMAVSLLHIVLPMQLINEKLFKIKSRQENRKETYEDSKPKFFTDYDLLNPIQQEQRTTKLYKLQKKKPKKNKDQDKKDNLPAAQEEPAAFDQEAQKQEEDEIQAIAQKTLGSFFDALERFSENVDEEPRRASKENKNPRVFLKTISALKALTPTNSPSKRQPGEPLA